MKFNVWPSSLLFLLTIGCATAPSMAQTPAPTPIPQPAPVARLEGKDYINDAFGLFVTLPSDWLIQSDQIQKQVTEQTRKMVEGTDDKNKQQFKQSIERSTILISSTKFLPGLPRNASFILVAERAGSPLITNGVDALRALENMARDSKNFSLEFQGGIRTEVINGKEFGVATIKNTSASGVFMQKAYIIMKNGYGLEFFFTYQEEADLPVFAAIMKTVQIK